MVSATPDLGKKMSSDYNWMQINKWKEGYDFVDNYVCILNDGVTYRYILRPTEIVCAEAMFGKMKNLDSKALAQKIAQANVRKLISFELTKLSPVIRIRSSRKFRQRLYGLYTQEWCGITGFEFFAEYTGTLPFYKKDPAPKDEYLYCYSEGVQRDITNAFTIHVPEFTGFDDYNLACGFVNKLINLIEINHWREIAKLQLKDIKGNLLGPSEYNISPRNKNK